MFKAVGKKGLVREETEGRRNSGIIFWLYHQTLLEHVPRVCSVPERDCSL